VQQSATRITRQGSNILLQADGEACNPGSAPYDANIEGYRFQYSASTQYVAGDG